MSNATATETSTRQGRRLDGTPNKVFSEKIVERHDDGTATYEKVWNNAKGERQVTQERKPLKKRGGGGRGMDLTPNREFNARRAKDNGDGTSTWIVPYNDANGVRHERGEIRENGRKGGSRSPESTPNKVISAIKAERIAEEDGAGNNVVLTVPYNDKDGERLEAFVTLQVNTKGNVTAKVVDEKPEVHVRQRRAKNSDSSE